MNTTTLIHSQFHQHHHHHEHKHPEVTKQQPQQSYGYEHASGDKYMPSSTTVGTTSLMDMIRSQGASVLGADPLGNSCGGEYYSYSSNKWAADDCATARLPSQPKSRPIRIDPKRQQQLRAAALRLSEEEEKEPEDEDIMSNSAELEQMYDHATWRMYILIQSARAAAPPRQYQPYPVSAQRVPHCSHHQDQNAHYHYHFTEGTTTTVPFTNANHHHAGDCRSSSRMAATQRIIAAGEKEDILFDFEL